MTTESAGPERPDPRKTHEPQEIPENRFVVSSSDIEDIPSLLNTLREELRNPRLWVFRGQTRWDWSLRPKRGRSGSPDESFPLGPSEEEEEGKGPHGLAGMLGSRAFRSLLDKEEFEDWKGEAISLVPPSLPRPASDLEWLAIGQHYGLETRLLDWTRNPLVGLYFAVREDPNYAGGDSALFALRGLSALPTSENIDPWKVRGVRLWHPPSLVERIGRQSGLFTLHQMGDKGGSLDLVSYAETQWGREMGLAHERFLPISDFQLVKLRIPSSARFALCRELSLLGVDEFFAFPDLQGLCAAYRSGRFRRPGLLQLLTDL